MCFMRKKVIERGLIGMIPLTTKLDPLLWELTNEVTILSDFHLKEDTANERRQEEDVEDKTIKSLFSGLKCT